VPCRYQTDRDGSGAATRCPAGNQSDRDLSGTVTRPAGNQSDRDLSGTGTRPADISLIWIAAELEHSVLHVSV
jgi:hypothetical protein